MSTGGATDYVGLFRPSGALPQNAAQLQFSMVCERPLPPSAALPLTEGENKASLPREGETRAKRARGSLTHHLELKLSNKPEDRGLELRTNEPLTWLCISPL